MSFTAVQSDIVAILQAAMPSPVKVLVSEDLAAVEERSQYTPAVHVVYGGYTVSQNSGTGEQAQVTYSFDIVGVSRSGVDRGLPATATATAGDLCLTAIRNLMGKNLPSAMRATPVRLASSARPVVSAGFVYVPASVEVEAIISSV